MSYFYVNNWKGLRLKYGDNWTMCLHLRVITPSICIWARFGGFGMTKGSRKGVFGWQKGQKKRWKTHFLHILAQHGDNWTTCLDLRVTWYRLKAPWSLASPSSSNLLALYDLTPGLWPGARAVGPQQRACGPQQRAFLNYTSLSPLTIQSAFLN